MPVYTLDLKRHITRGIFKCTKARKSGRNDSIPPCKKGDAFFIPAGTVHAIGEGILLAEIQEASDITYRIFDWNRKDENGLERELHIEEALEAINYKQGRGYKMDFEDEPNSSVPIVKSEFFNISNCCLIARYTNRIFKLTHL